MKEETELFVKWAKKNCPDYFEMFCLYGKTDGNEFFEDCPPEDYIMSAFGWIDRNGDEGQKYWSDMNKRWETYLKKKKKEEEIRLKASSYVVEKGTLRLEVSDQVSCVIIDIKKGDSK